MKKSISIVLAIIEILVINLALLFLTTPTIAQSSKYEVKFASPDDLNLPQPAVEAITEALNSWPNSPLKDNTFYITAVMWHDKWAGITLTPENINEIGLNINHLFLAFLILTDDSWKAAIDSDPETELSGPARSNLFPTLSQNSCLSTSAEDQLFFDYKFPWAAEEPWHLSNNWHGGTMGG